MSPSMAGAIGWPRRPENGLGRVQAQKEPRLATLIIGEPVGLAGLRMVLPPGIDIVGA